MAQEIMDEKYIQAIYDQLGGEAKFGSYDDFKNVISTNPEYRKQFHYTFGESELGPYNDFDALVKKKDSTSSQISSTPSSTGSEGSSSAAPSLSPGKIGDIKFGVQGNVNQATPEMEKEVLLPKPVSNEFGNADVRTDLPYPTKSKVIQATIADPTFASLTSKEKKNLINTKLIESGFTTAEKVAQEDAAIVADDAAEAERIAKDGKNAMTIAEYEMKRNTSTVKHISFEGQTYDSRPIYHLNDTDYSILPDGRKVKFKGDKWVGVNNAEAQQLDYEISDEKAQKDFKSVPQNITKNLFNSEIDQPYVNDVNKYLYHLKETQPDVYDQYAEKVLLYRGENLPEKVNELLGGDKRQVVNQDRISIQGIKQRLIGESQDYKLGDKADDLDVIVKRVGGPEKIQEYQQLKKEVSDPNSDDAGRWYAEKELSSKFAPGQITDIENAIGISKELYDGRSKIDFANQNIVKDIYKQQVFQRAYDEAAKQEKSRYSQVDAGKSVWNASLSASNGVVQLPKRLDFDNEYGLLDLWSDSFNESANDLKAVTANRILYDSKTGEWDGSAFLPLVTGGLTSMTLLAGGGLALGRATGIGNAGVVASGFTIQHNDYYEQALNSGEMTPQQANLYAIAAAGLTSMLELVSPGEKIFGKAGLEYLSTKTAMKEFASGKSLSEILDAKGILKEMSHEMLQEGTQDVGDRVANVLTNNVIGKDALNTNYTLNDFTETMATTAAVTFLAGGFRGMVSRGKSREEIVNRLAGNNLIDLALQSVQNNVDAGIITEDKAFQLTEELTKRNTQINALPKEFGDAKKDKIIEFQDQLLPYQKQEYSVGANGEIVKREPTPEDKATITEIQGKIADLSAKPNEYFDNELKTEQQRASEILKGNPTPVESVLSEDGLTPEEKATQIDKLKTAVDDSKIVNNKSTDALSDIQATNKALQNIIFKEGSDENVYSKEFEEILNLVPNIVDILPGNPKTASEIISEEYHKVKQDGSNPELVNAVEKALEPNPDAHPQTKNAEAESKVDFTGKDNNYLANKEPGFFTPSEREQYNELMKKPETESDASKMVSDKKQELKNPKPIIQNEEANAPIEKVNIPGEEIISNETVNATEGENANAKGQEVLTTDQNELAGADNNAPASLSPLLADRSGNSEAQTKNIVTATEILKNSGVDASFSGYSDTNGVSVYFKDKQGIKYRVSDHGVQNINRIENEILLRFDQKTIGINGEGIKYNQSSNKKEIESSIININTQENATKERIITENDKSEHQNGNQIPETAETSSSNSVEQRQEDKKEVGGDNGKNPPPIKENGDGTSSPPSGIIHRATAETREEFGFDHYEKQVVTDLELNRRADEEISKGYNVERLMKKLEGGEIPTSLETTILKKYKKVLEDRISADPSNENILQLKRLVEVSDLSRSDIGRSLRAGRDELGVEDSLGDFFVREMEVRGVDELTDAQRLNVINEFDNINRAKTDLENKIKDLEEENSRLKALKSVRDEKSKSKKTNKTHQEYINEREEIAEKIKKKWNDASKDDGMLKSVIIPLPFTKIKQLIAVAPDVNNMMKSLVHEGLDKLDTIINNIHDTLKDNIEGLTKEDLRDIIAGQYSEPKNTKNEIQEQLHNLRLEAKLLKRIEDLENGIPTSDRGKRIQSEEIKRLREKIKSLKNNSGSSDINTKEPDKLKAIKTQLESKIKTLEEELRTGNFIIKEEKPVELDKEAIDLKDKLIRLRGERNKRLVQEKYANRSVRDRVIGTVGEILNIPRTLMSSLDFSAVLRQGLIPTISHPVIASKALKEMFLQAVSQKRFDRWFHDLRESEAYKTMEDSGLYVADPHDVRLSTKEETFMNNWAEKVPIIGESIKIGDKTLIPGIGAIKASERAYVSYLNKMRVDLFANGMSLLESQGKTFKNSPELYKGLASFINSASGRGGVSKTIEKMSPFLSAALFAPRLIASRLNMLGLSDVLYGGKGFYGSLPKEIRILALKDMAKFIGFGLSLLALVKFACPDCVEDDPRSSDFAKIHVGNTRYDIWGGFQQYFVFFTKLLMNQKITAADNKVHELDGSGRGTTTRLGLVENFTRGKLAPIPSIGVDYFAGRQMNYQPFNLKQEAKNHLLPLLYQDIKEAIDEQGAMGLVTVGLPGMFGIGVQTYDSDKNNK